MSKALRKAKQDEERLTAFLVQLAAWMPEPPHGWREDAKPPGSTPRTSGRVGKPPSV